jgi:pilus assembly protein FimV
VGQPLSLVAQVQVDATENTLPSCFEADVSYGDVRQLSSGVKISIEGTTQADQVHIRIAVLAPVDEPFVVVELRAICGQKTARRYVLLAEVQSELDAPVALPLAPAIKATLAAVGARTQPSPMVDSSQVRPGKSRSRANGVRSRDRTTLLRATRPAPGAAVAGPVAISKGASSGGKSRLKLDLSELLLEERDPTLKISSELTSNPTDIAQVREQAAALWHAINLQPEDALRDAQRLKGLDLDVQNLRSLVQNSQKTLVDLNAQVRLAETERFDRFLVYGLVALLLAASVAVVYLWRRQRDLANAKEDWWSGSTMESDGSHRHGAPVQHDGISLVSTDAVSSGTPVPVSQPVSKIDIDLDMNESMFDGLNSANLPTGAMIAKVEQQNTSAPSAAAAHSGRDFALSTTGGLHSPTTVELFDIRHQADFFVSLGQYDQAIQILETCIGERDQVSPLVYLDLLKIFHTLGRKADFELRRNNFNRLFTGRVPAFASFNDEGQGLDAYPEIFSQITRLWLSDEVVDLIDGFIFRNPAGDFNQSIDLKAYRELLLLRGIARRVLGPFAGFADSADAPLTLNPFAASTGHNSVHASKRPAGLETELMVDIDLSAPQAIQDGVRGSAEPSLPPLIPDENLKYKG